MRDRQFIVDESTAVKPHEPPQPAVARPVEADAVAKISLERLLALEQMSQRLTHDLNNALSPVLAYAELLLEDPHLSDDHRQKLARIVDAALRGFGILRKLELFHGLTSRGPLQLLNFAGLIREAIEQILRSTGGVSESAESRDVWRRIELETDDTISVSANSDELRRLVAELVINALQASRVDAPVRVRLCRRELFACLEVIDAGRGMSAEACARCLEPFQTTKIETGAGLGLSIARGAARRLGGTLRIDSHVGQGTAVTVLVPLPDVTVR